ALLGGGSPEAVGEHLREHGHAMFLAMPSAMRIWAAVPNAQPCPITVRDGRSWLTEYAKTYFLQEIPEVSIPRHGEAAVLLDDIWFKYEKDLPDVVRGLSLKAHYGELFAILGGNGAGKTTSLGVIGGLRKAYRGSAQVTGTVGALPQNPQTLFVKKTVREDLLEIFKGGKLTKSEKEEKTAHVVRLCRLEDLLDRHPYDLSGGEQQRAALAKVLLTNPEILLLDEPTKGLDAEYKQVFAGVLQTLVRRGVAIVLVSHDVEFCAKYAHRCAMFFDGNIVAEGTPREFFSGNSFYTTSANRMARGLVQHAITPEDVIAVCGGAVPQEPKLPDEAPPLPPPREELEKPKKLPLWRKLAATVSGAAAAISFITTIRVTDLSAVVSGAGVSEAGVAQFYTAAVFIAAMLTCSFAIGRKSKPPLSTVQVAREKRKLPKRTVAAAVLILLLIPVTLFVGSYYFADRKYYFISLLVILETMIPFFLVFESRRPQARELVIIAVLCAIGVAGRVVFYVIPNFNPVIALVIIAGIAFGGETGFLVGAVVMIASNVMLSQGPWTPFQMFVMGLIGFLAGVLFRKGLLRRAASSMCVFGAVSAVLIYGGLMNPVAALIYARSLQWEVLLAYYVTGFPIDLIQAAATVFFLYAAAEPMLEKLDRIKVKYGLVEAEADAELVSSRVVVCKNFK
ncbi:MAG: ATP-binding cassette domain-containing protein, partial [Clostridiales bacterium]|nr:ATP-binding cassette domain-containing protein [Clostridiales bacterium]